MNVESNTRPRAALRMPGQRRWQGGMIAPASDMGVYTQCSFLRRRFTLDRVAGDERLYISAQGLYRCFLNGERVGKDVLTPGWTNYDQRLPYRIYEISALLREGENTLDIWLGDGWFRSQLMWRENAIHNCYGFRTAAIAEITSGESILMATDEKWESGLLPIRKSGIYFGEIYDAREEELVPTAAVQRLAFDTDKLYEHETCAVQELAPLPALESWEDAEGTVYDFGQNLGGYVSFTVEGARGARVIVEHSEITGPNRKFDNRNYRTAAARLEYTLKGGGSESYRPHFTFQGFRYARLRIEGRAEISEISAIPVSSVPEIRGSFSSANPLVDRLVLNTVWSQRANFIEVPTDCPQRDERMGWTGDAQVFAPTACYLANSHGVLVKYLRDVMIDQREDGAIPHFSPDPTRLHPSHFPGFYGSTGWGDAITIIPWTLYEHYGDRDILEECYPAMIRWVDFVWSISDGPIVEPPLLWGDRGFSFGDWLQPTGDNRKPRATIGDDCAATLYHYISTDLLGRIARLLGDAATAERMERRAGEIRAAFAHEFVTASGRLGYNDQTSYALAFLHDLIPEEHVEAAKGHFREAIAQTGGRIGTGFIGTPALLPALCKIGAQDLAEQMFLQEGVPGWLYQVKMGATSIWERWDALGEDGTIYDPMMNSYNHYAYGAVCQWLFEEVAGFRPDAEDPGFARIRFAPAILPRLSPVSARHESIRGTVAAGWKLEGETVRYSVTVPEGAEGIFEAPQGSRDIAIDGSPGESGASLAPGEHEITFRVDIGAA